MNETPSPSTSLDGDLPDLAHELAVACRIARTAGALAHRYFTAWHGSAEQDSAAAADGALPVEWKDGDEPVTAADRAVNQLCVDGLRREFPSDAILSEELPDDGTRKTAKRTWLVDPIDGTKDFIAGRPGYSVMIGLLIDGRPRLGVVYQPPGDRLFYASQGCGAFVVDEGAPPRRLRVSSIDSLSQSRMVSSASVHEPLVAKVRERAGIRDELRIGSVGIKLSLVAAGDCDLYINPAGKTKLWDSGAPSIILSEAGGRLTDIDGQPLNYRGALGHLRGLVATNGALHDQALRQLAPFAAAKSR